MATASFSAAPRRRALLRAALPAAAAITAALSPAPPGIAGPLLPTPAPAPASAATAAAAQHHTAMDYDPFQCPLPVVRLSVNGSEPLPFAVDTGFAGAVAVFERFADRAKVGGLPETGTVTLQPGNAVARIVTAPGARLAPAAKGRAAPGGNPDLGAVDVWVLPSGPLTAGTLTARGGEPVAGLVGRGLLRAFRVELDFAGGALTLTPAGGPAAKVPAGATRVPLEIDPTHGVATVRAELEGRGGKRAPVAFTLDTGANHCLVPTAVAARAGGAEAERVGEATGTVAGVRRESRQARFPALRLGAARETAFVALLESAADNPAPFAAVLGVDFLARFARVTIDFPGRALVLERGADHAARSRGPGYAGVLLTRLASETSTAVVTGVLATLPGSPGEKAGFRRLDVVTAIDGVDVRRLSPYEVAHRLDGRQGAASRVTVARTAAPGGGAGVTSVTLDLPARGDAFLLDRVVWPRRGLVFARLQGPGTARARLFLANVIDPAHPERYLHLERARVKPFGETWPFGSEVTQIDGRPVSGLSPADLVALDGASASVGRRLTLRDAGGTVRDVSL